MIAHEPRRRLATRDRLLEKGVARAPIGTTGRHPLRIVFLVLLAFWVVSPLLLLDAPAQDGPAFLAAARLVRTDPGAVFGAQIQDPRTDAERTAVRRWTEEYCRADVAGTCEINHAGYLSPPAALPLYEPFTLLDPRAALFALRLVAALTMALGMELVWRIIAPTTDGERRILVVSTVLLTPIAINVVALGQNTGVLFVSAALGVTACTRGRPGRTLATAVALGASIVLKILPGGLLLILALQRRGRLIAAVTGVVLALVLVSLVHPISLWTDLLSSLAAYREGASSYSYNRSLDAIVRGTVAPSLGTGGAIAAGSLLLRLGALASIWFARVRHLDDDIQLAFGWVGFILLNDYVWPHYFVLLVPLAAFVARRRPSALWTLPVAAGATAVLLATWPFDVAGRLVALVAMAGGLALPFLAPRTADAPAPTDTVPA